MSPPTRSTSASPRDWHGRVSFSRQQPARFVYFVHEFVLRLPVGGTLVMSDQLHHLLRMSVRPYICVRVVPAAHGAHSGLAGSFTLMDFAAIKSVVYVESLTSTLFLEEPAEIAAYRRVVASLAETALDEEQSRAMIRNIAVQLYGDREDDDEQD